MCTLLPQTPSYNDAQGCHQVKPAGVSCLNQSHCASGLCMGHCCGSSVSASVCRLCTSQTGDANCGVCGGSGVVAPSGHYYLRTEGGECVLVPDAGVKRT